MKRTRQSSQEESHEEQNVALIDRLSNLPDGVICHILSFLSAKTSAATSFLARRWRFLWAHVPNLEFDSNDRRSVTSFSSTINRVLSLREIKSINTLRFFCDDFECSENELETIWIITTIEHNVKKMDFGLDLEMMLPRCLFTCKTLVDLSLSFCVAIPRSVSLPSLKKLLLYSIQYNVDEALPHLLSCCPVLEDLTIDGLVDEKWAA